jgi:apolipoprotein N-acyltransferase
MSIIIDPYSRIVDRVKGEKCQDIYVRGVLTGFIISLGSETIYTRCRDWFVWVALGGSVMFLAVDALKGGKR